MLTIYGDDIFCLLSIIYPNIQTMDTQQSQLGELATILESSEKIYLRKIGKVQLAIHNRELCLLGKKLLLTPKKGQLPIHNAIYILYL